MTILAELRAANGNCIANFSGPNASEFQFRCAGGRIVLSMTETNCARWRRKSVPVWLRENGREALFLFAARVEARGT
ncbi:MAG TPA: hypothetical protein VIF02_02860 [Methylocella sp.]